MTHKRAVGSKKIDIVTPFGRLNRHTGFNTTAGKRKCEAVVRKLIEDGQADTLRALHDDEISFFELVDADREGKLTGTRVLDQVRLRETLASAKARLLKSMGRADKTRLRYETALDKLIASVELPKKGGGVVAGASLTLKGLADVDWKVLERQDRWKSAADWNHMRRSVSALLTVFFGTEHHHFRAELIESIPLRTERPRIPDISVAQFWEIVRATPEHARPCYVSLVGSGLRLGEYLRLESSHLIDSEFGIDVPGTKTEESAARVYVDKELWPWLRAGVPSPLKERWMGIYWRRACLKVGVAQRVGTGEFRMVRTKRATSGPYRKGEQPEFTLREITRYQGPRIHDLRHLFAQVADAAGLTAETVASALRHSRSEQAAEYKRRAAAREVANVVGRGLMAAMPGRRAKRARKAG